MAGADVECSGHSAVQDAHQAFPSGYIKVSEAPNQPTKINAALAHELGLHQKEGEFLLAWPLQSTSKHSPCLVLPCDQPFENTQDPGLQISAFTASCAAIESGKLCAFTSIAEHFIPVAQSVLLEVSLIASSSAHALSSAESSHRSLELGNVEMLSSSMQLWFSNNQAVLTSGSTFNWSSPTDEQISVKVALEVVHNECGVTLAEPNLGWSGQEWHKWLGLRKQALVTEVTSFKVICTASWTHGSTVPLQVKDSNWEIERVKRVFRDVKEGNCIVRSLALVVGPHDAPALSLLRAMWPKAYFSVLSAATLKAEYLSDTHGSDLALMRQWVLGRVEVGIPSLMAFVRPSHWFRDSGSDELSKCGACLCQLVDRCRWRASAEHGHYSSTMMVFLFDAAPPKKWDQLGMFDETVSLESHFTRFAGARYDANLVECKRLPLDEHRFSKSAKDWISKVITAVSASGSGLAIDACRFPCRVVACGPQGSGKTMFLSSLMHLLPVRVIPFSVPHILSAGVGDTQAAVRQLFEDAKHLQPSCITLDDADALFAKSGHESHGKVDMLTELVHMLDNYCSANVLFAATCSAMGQLPSPLACRVQCIQMYDT